MADLAQVIINTFTPTASKLLAAIVLFLSFLFGDLYNQAILAVLMLLLFDTILGVHSAWIEGSAITSRKFSRVVWKGFVYMISISAAFFLDQTLPFVIAQTTMIAFVATTEFISILENMGRLGYATPKKLLNQLKDFKSQK